MDLRYQLLVWYQDLLDPCIMSSNIAAATATRSPLCSDVKQSPPGPVLVCISVFPNLLSQNQSCIYFICVSLELLCSDIPYQMYKIILCILVILFQWWICSGIFIINIVGIALFPVFIFTASWYMFIVMICCVRACVCVVTPNKPDFELLAQFASHCIFQSLFSQKVIDSL